MNIVDLNQRRMANVEAYEDRVGKHEVTSHPTAASNYSHFNHFKEIMGVAENVFRNSSYHRQARIDALPPPASSEDIAERLSDTSDPDWPIYRQMTLATFVLDGATRRLQMWCCGHSATSGPPEYTFFLDRLFS